MGTDSCRYSVINHRSTARRYEGDYLSSVMATIVLSRSLWRQRAFHQPGTRIQSIAMSRRRPFSSYFVTPKEVHEALRKNPPTAISTDAKVIPICAAWFMPNDPEKRTGLDVFQKKRIPTARFFDIDEIKDKESEYPHMLPTCDEFAHAMSKLGVRKEDELVIYDTEELGLFSAPRVAWTMRVYGHPKVHVLNNFRLWGKEGAEDIQILDARSKGRWEGTEPEPRPGLKSGHMPGSTSLPFQELLDPETKTMLPKEALRKIFEDKHVDLKKPIITSCGTGVTAAIIEAALKEADYGAEDDRRLYDGSWTEWASRVSPTSGLIQSGRST